MTEPRTPRPMASRPPARHELPEIDAAALRAAGAADRLLAEAGRRAEANLAAARWARFLERLPDQLRDEPPAGLRAAARRIRAAYGAKDSIRDTFPVDLTEPLLDATDRLLKAISRYEARGD